MFNRGDFEGRGEGLMQVGAEVLPRGRNNSVFKKGRVVRRGVGSG